MGSCEPQEAAMYLGALVVGILFLFSLIANLLMLKKFSLGFNFKERGSGNTMFPSAATIYPYLLAIMVIAFVVVLFVRS